jgi:hypothetical protein
VGGQLTAKLLQEANVIPDGRAIKQSTTEHLVETERFITSEEAAAFLCCSPVTVKRLARQGKLPGHWLTNGIRKRWRFLISELAVAVKSEVSSERSSAPLSQKKGRAA